MMQIDVNFQFKMSRSLSNFFVVNILLLNCFAEKQYSEYNQYTYLLNNIEDDLSASKSPMFGQLTGDVQNWAQIIQNYILQVGLHIIYISL